MTERVYVPPIKIQGIKTKLVPLIKQSVAMDRDSVWFEPFMGSGVVGFNVRPRRAVFADTNPHIIEFYRQMKRGVITPLVIREFLEREGKLLEQGEDAHYYEIRARFNREHSPLDFLFLNRACFNGMIRFNKNYDFNVPYGHKPKRFAKAYVTKIVNQAAHVADLLSAYDWDFVCQPFEETIALAGEGDFIYCDPPYIGRHVDYYDSWDEEAEVLLHRALVQSGARFMLSTWERSAYRRNDYIALVWGDCEKLTREHFYHVGAREVNRRPVLEALLTNYAVGGERAGLSGGGELFDTASAL